MTEHIMQFFSYAHLPADKQAISKPFGDLAEVVMTLPRNPERTVALRKLLEAKDAAVRASFAKDAAVVPVQVGGYATRDEVSAGVVAALSDAKGAA